VSGCEGEACGVCVSRDGARCDDARGWVVGLSGLVDVSASLSAGVAAVWFTKRGRVVVLDPAMGRTLDRRGVLGFESTAQGWLEAAPLSVLRRTRRRGLESSETPDGWRGR
jgi:hypothetical protein